MKRVIFLYFLPVFIIINAIFAEVKIIEPTSEQYSSFAIVVDKATFHRVENAILKYRDAIQSEDKLSVYIVIIKDENPEAIKSEILKLYNSSPKLEGAVFIGDIPVPMIRGAQHMASAFKMEEAKYDWSESSVPSDRFYDDFDLKFDFLKQDSTDALLYYYSLSPGSPQKIHKDIYSGRIKSPYHDDSKYETVKIYLEKAVASKKNPELLDYGFVFSGHGNQTEALTSWNDEAIALREQFPKMFDVGGKLKYLRASMAPDMKDIVMKEVSNKKADLAIFHAHGLTQAQYLTGDPLAETFQENIEAIKKYLRKEIRSAKEKEKDVEETKKDYKENYNLTEEWFEGAFVDSVVRADSLDEYNTIIHSDELSMFSPQAEFILFDECFNGAFQAENYISGRYLFGSGNVIAALAGSVGVLQDLWSNQLIGLLGYGVSVGNWFKENNYLEYHIIGDPTFHFKEVYVIDLNRKIVEEANNVEFWKSLLKSSEPEVRSLAVIKLYNLLGDEFIPDLFEIYKTDNSYNVRGNAFCCLADSRSEEFEKVLPVSINDPFEYIRRISGKLMGETGDDKYIPYMVRSIINDESNRINFMTKNALSQMNYEKVKSEIEKAVSELPEYMDKEEIKSSIETTVDQYKRLLNEAISIVNDDTLKLGKRIFYSTILRNRNYIEALSPFLKVITDEEAESELRIAIIEALGWYTYSSKREDIINTVNEIIKTGTAPKEVLAEAIKTKNRLSVGSNVSITP
ncbi:MAG: hypothetical protein PVH88_24005 [Ignavibacteria bacterium]|jgi:hypothetical protein